MIHDRLDLIPIHGGTIHLGLSDLQVAVLVRTHPEAADWLAKGRLAREQPVSSLRVPAFRIARTPVTVGEYRHFLDAGGYRHEAYWTPAGWEWRSRHERRAPDFWGLSPWTDSETLPVVGVSWYEAVAYCHWASQEAGERIELPSEVQWEWAARGPSHFLLPWGNTFNPTYCNARSAGAGKTCPVKRGRSAGDSPFGISDMIGNVSEWTRSRYAAYPYRPEETREAIGGDSERTTRGGSWHSPDLRARTTSRGMNDPWFADNDLGFRIAAKL